MSHRKLKYLNDNRIIYRKYSSDTPTAEYNWGWHYEDGTRDYYSLFNTKYKINTMRSLRWHLLTLLYLNPELNKDKFTKLANYITNKDNGFVTFNKRPCGIHGIIDKFLKGNRNIPPHNKIRKIVFKDSTGLNTSEKLSIVGKIAGKIKNIKQDDIYDAMLCIHDNGKITMKKLSEVLKCSVRTIHRNMGEELKKEKELLNRQYEKV